MATISPVASSGTDSGAIKVTPHQKNPHQHHRRQFYGIRIPVEEDPENFVPVADADGQNSTDAAGPAEKFFTASVSTIDREFAPKPPFRLPSSWIPVEHTSGLTVYLHKPTKVVTLARPYFAGSVPLRNHLIPLACLPCLGYSRGLQSAGLQCKATRGIQTDSDNVDVVLLPSTEPTDQPSSQETVECNEDKTTVKPEASNDNAAYDSDAEEGEITSSENDDDAEDDKSKLKSKTVRKRCVVEPAPSSVEAKRPRLTPEASNAPPLPPPPPPPPPPLSISACPVSSIASNVQAPVDASGGVEGAYLSHAEVRAYCRRLFRYRTERRQVCQLPGQARPVQLPLVLPPQPSTAAASSEGAPDDSSTSGSPQKAVAAPSPDMRHHQQQHHQQYQPRHNQRQTPSSSGGPGRLDSRNTPRNKLILINSETGRRERLINPVGKMPASVIADLQVAPDRQFRYEYQRVSESELRCNLLSHDGRQLGTGVGKNKRLARHMAALSGLETLVPNFDQFKDDLLQHPSLVGSSGVANGAVTGGAASAAGSNEKESGCDPSSSPRKPNAQQMRGAANNQSRRGKSPFFGRSQQPPQQPPQPPQPPQQSSSSAATADSSDQPAEVPDDFKSIASTDPRAVALLKRHKLPRMRCLLSDYMRGYCIEESELRIEYAMPTPAAAAAASAAAGSSAPGNTGGGGGRHHRPHQQHSCCLTLRGSQSGQCIGRSKAVAYDLAAQRLLAQAYPMAGSFYSILKLVGPLSHAAATAGQKNEFAEVQEQLKNSDRGTLKKGLLDMLRRKLRELGRNWTEYGPQFKGKFYDIPELLPRIEPHPDSALPTFSLEETADPAKTDEPVEEAGLTDKAPDVAIDVEVLAGDNSEQQPN